MVESIAWSSGVIMAASIIAAVTDIWKFKVHNLLTFPLMLSGIAYHTWVNGPQGFQASVVGVCFAFALLIIPYVGGGMGAGDVKFLMGVGAWLGIQATYFVLIVGLGGACVYGTVLAVRYGQWRDKWVNLKIMFYRLMTIGHYLRAGDELERVQETVKKPERNQQLIPVSAMMALGVMTFLIWQHWIAAATKL